jgi:hypothetical protein
MSRPAIATPIVILAKIDESNTASTEVSAQPWMLAPAGDHVFG